MPKMRFLSASFRFWYASFLCLTPLAHIKIESAVFRIETKAMLVARAKVTAIAIQFSDIFSHSRRYSGSHID
ncbi:MAG: hypothetical protein HC878_13625 [Leptolyngbyaceae cyanobacterium SL_5_14]|nr:hypothetical protein [Leptolyngbyaceae cyanobacterium SL_5_14]